MRRRQSGERARYQAGRVFFERRGWCELRADYRNFRVERIQSSKVLDEHFDQDGGRLFREWSALPKERPTL